VLWSKKESYLPEQLKTADQVGESQYDLGIEIPEGTNPLTVDVYPTGAGDYGFYISELRVTIHMIVY
jgi:hypothetical protein